MAYRIIAKTGVAGDLVAIPEPQRDRIQAAILALADNPRPIGALKMAGFKNTYRIRVGNFRIGYQIFDKELVVAVVAAGERGRVYSLMRRRIRS